MSQSKEDKNRHYRVDDQHPYPGLSSFREEDRDYFFGREREIAELSEYIKSNVLTVVFGKAGIGKTSLLQAGLIPKLRKEYYLPIYIRIRFQDDKESPLEQVKAAIEPMIKDLDKTAGSFNGDTLWEYFYHLRVFEGRVRPLLFFDQFEELFTAGKQKPGEIDPLVTEIGDLVQNWMPAAVQGKYQDQPIAYTSKKPNYRVIFSLREEYLSKLKNLYPYMPSIVNGRYHFRMQQMKKKDAVAAVWEPGKKIIKNREVAEAVVKKIPRSQDTDYNPYEEQDGSWENQRIEPFLLSLFCYKLNQMRLESNIGVISAELLAEVQARDIIEDYYEENIQPAVRHALEDQLLTEEGYRKLQDVDTFKKYGDVRNEEVETLIEKRIVRKESRNNIDYIELIHDVLTPILKKSRDKRKEKEKRKKELKEKMQKYTRLFFVVISTAALFLALLTWYAFQQKRFAEEKGRNARAYELAARSALYLEKNLARSFQFAQEAYKTEKSNPEAYNALLTAYYKISIENQGSQFKEHSSQTAHFFAAYSPDGTRVLTVSPDKAILWNLNGHKEKTGKPRGNFKLSKKAAFSPDGKYIVFLTMKDKEIGKWNPQGEEILSLTLPLGVNSVVFSPDSRKILTGNMDNTAGMWDLQGKKIKIFQGHTGEVNSAVFSPDGKYILTASLDKTALLWIYNTKQIKVTFEHPDCVYSAVFSANGHYILTASRDGTARIWDLKGKEIKKFEGHTGEVKLALFSPNGKYIITTSDDKTARLWDLMGRQVYKFKEFDEIINTASFSPDGKYILIAPALGPAQIRLIDPEEIISNVRMQKMPDK